MVRLCLFVVFLVGLLTACNTGFSPSPVECGAGCAADDTASADVNSVDTRGGDTALDGVDGDPNDDIDTPDVDSVDAPDTDDTGDIDAGDPLQCELGSADCDADPDNGCETETWSNPLNCGGCGVTCGALEICDAAQCVPCPGEACGACADPATPLCDAGDPTLVACFGFDGAGLEALTDGSSYGHTPTMISAFDVRDGIDGQAGEFTAETVVVIERTEAFATMPPATLTVELWANADALPVEGARWTLYDNEGRSSLSITREGWQCSSNGYGPLTGGEVSPGQWTSVACVADGQSLRLVVDGVTVGSLAAGMPFSPTDEPITIGSNSPALDQRFLGAIDRLRVWSVARTDEQLCVEAAVGAR